MSHAHTGGQAPNQASSGRQTGAAAHTRTDHSQGTHIAASHLTSHTRHGGIRLATAPDRPTRRVLPSHEDEVRQLWNEHLNAPFPRRLGGVEIAGVEMVLLDADIAGCVQTWLSNRGGRLDEQRKEILRSCLNEADRVLPLLQDGGEREYYERLRRLARLALG